MTPSASDIQTLRVVKIQADLDEILADLAGELYIVRGDTVADLDRLEPRFRYASSQGSDPLPTTVTRKPPSPAEGTPHADTQAFLDGHLQDPVLLDLQIEATSACNERCKHCYLPDNRIRKTLDGSVIHSVLAELSEMGGVGVTFSGGEFLLRRDAPDILRHARASDLKISALSNATLVTEAIAEALAAVNPAQIQVSVYSIDPSVHDAITGLPGSLMATLAGIAMLHRYDVPCEISCPVMTSNKASFPAVLAWAKGMGMKAAPDLILMGRGDLTTDNLDERPTRSGCRAADSKRHRPGCRLSRRHWLPKAGAP